MESLRNLSLLEYNIVSTVLHMSISLEGGSGNSGISLIE